LPLVRSELPIDTASLARAIWHEDQGGWPRHCGSIDRSLDGLDLCRKRPLWLARSGPPEAGETGQSTRIGISRDADHLLRFYLRMNPFVSGPRSLNE
jgi:3-methyladenine DNA glycosylase Mpg